MDQQRSHGSDGDAARKPASPPACQGDEQRRLRLRNLYNPIVQALIRFTIEDLLTGAPEKHRALFTIKSEETLEACLRVLNDNNILSLPVLDEQNFIVGNLDLLDIMAFYADIFRKFRPNKVPDPAFKLVERRFRSKEIRFPGEDCVREYGESLRPIVEDIWMEVPVSRVMGFFKQNRCDFVNLECSVAEVAQTLTGEKKHRSLLLRARGLEPPFHRDDVITVISQHDIAVFVRQILYWALGNSDEVSQYHSDLFNQKIQDLRQDISEVMHTKIKDLGVETEMEKPIISISVHAPVIEAIKYLVQNSVSVVAATGFKGRLVNCFSGADLRHITPSNWDALVKHLSEFFSDAADGKSPLIVIDKEYSLIRAIERFAVPGSQIVHHVWICDECGHAVGVLSLTDLMRIAATYHLPGTVTRKKNNRIGTLSVTILLAENLPPSKSRYRVGRDVYAKVDYPFVKSVRTPVTSGQLSPSFRDASFQFTVTARDIGKELVISIMDKKRVWRMGDKVLGHVKFEIAWIVNSYANDKHKNTLRKQMRKNGKESGNGILIVQLDYNPE